MKKHVSNFTIRLNSITTTGALYPVQMTKESATKAQGGTKIVSCSPEGKPVKRVYVPADDPTGGTVYYDSQLEKATVDTDGNYHLVGKTNLAAAKESPLPKNVLNLTVHEEAELDGKVWPSDHRSYVFVPNGGDNANVQWHNLLRELVAKSGKAFCGQAVISTSDEAFYRVKLWRGNLVIVRQVPPEWINDISEGDDSGIKESTFQKAMTAVANMVTPFNPEDYRSKAVEAVVSLTGKAVNGEIDVDTVVVPVVAVDEFDIDAALDGFGDV